ncbi:hypothetical protein R1sor_016454 [Riccia sorocarpa]|uniref:CCHC-type domain-containing protein n=1 Tax=Riccia sorocarpa TaxID=122646 RepID=A0ABD3HIJ8_9MARC
MIYTTPWEPGFDTHKVLDKKMAVWLDLLNVDPMMEGVGKSLLASLGTILQVAGVTDKQKGTFANIRGCVLMDMTKPLPTVMILHMNGIQKKVKIRYDILPDVCFRCHERRHFARICPKYKQEQEKGKAVNPQEPNPEAEFTEVTGKGKNKTGNDEDTGVTSVDPLVADGRPLQTTQEVNETLPDLNVTLTASTELNNEKAEKKKSKKARQKEKRRETLLAKMAETGTQNQNKSQTEAMEAEESGESSSDEKDSREDRLWKKKGEKKQKGEKEVMETTAGWNNKRRREKIISTLSNPMSYTEEFKIVIWNVNGLGGADRIRVVKSWLQNTGKGVKVLAILELKTREQQVEFNLRTIMPRATVVVDYALNEVGGTALVIHGELANDKEWVLVGDWNMVLSQDDSTCPSPLLKGGPLQAWEATNMRWHLEDVYDLAVKKIGPRFTRQAVRGDRLNQSWLDRAYINKNASWVKEVLQITHDGTEALSDHCPVIIELNVDKIRGRRKKKRKDVYTKMDIDSMRNPERRRQIKAAWEEGWLLSTDPAIA